MAALDLKKLSMDQLFLTRSVPWGVVFPEIKRREALAREKSFDEFTNEERVYLFSLYAASASPSRPPSKPAPPPTPFTHKTDCPGGKERVCRGNCWNEAVVALGVERNHDAFVAAEPRIAAYWRPRADDEPVEPIAAPSCASCGKVIADGDEVACGPCAEKCDENGYDRPEDARKCARCGKGCGKSMVHARCAPQEQQEPEPEKEKAMARKTTTEPESPEFQKLAAAVHTHLTVAQFNALVAHEQELHGATRSEAIAYVATNAESLALRWGFKTSSARPDTFGFTAHAPLASISTRAPAPPMLSPAEIERACLMKSRQIAARDKISVSAASERLKTEEPELYRAYAGLHR